MDKARCLRFGPGMLVAAAFIGPGTVITASRAGAEAGCNLLWAVSFATLGAIVLQLLAARIGIVARQGLGEQLRAWIGKSIWFQPVAGLVICALGIGNAAYQTGNLSGAAAGLSGVVGGKDEVWIITLALGTMMILSIGHYRTLQRVLIGLVVLLSMCFLTTAALSLPPIGTILSGLFLPQLSGLNATLVIGLIGTTIVPYNLFLHASSASENWSETETGTALRQSAIDTSLSIGLGGLVTAAILVTANQAFFVGGLELDRLGDVAEQLRPVLGDISGLAFAVGLFAAGLTSAITAPLATAYALCGILGWAADPRLAFSRDCLSCRAGWCLFRGHVRQLPDAVDNPLTSGQRSFVANRRDGNCVVCLARYRTPATSSVTLGRQVDRTLRHSVGWLACVSSSAANFGLAWTTHRQCGVST